MYTAQKNIKDQGTISIHIPGTDDNFSVPTGGVAWDTTTDPPSGITTITTMYGVDLNPAGTDLHTTGFDADQAAALEFQSETFIGNSGTLYSGVSLGTPTLAELPALFPGLDLSLFGGNPSSVVYAFQTTVPSADIGAPEPSTAVLAVVACGLMCVLRKRFK
jgi:hypothetical protein